ncbi:MAG: transglycosylase domain-containing protein [Firmicutes bacterium]|nr:transglycosylase domain-containing protein [Bacillota bacterium]
MSDKYNNNYNSRRNDIDDFFAEFDRQAAAQNRPSSRKSDTTRYSAPSRTTASRSSKSSSRSSKRRSAADSVSSLKSSIAKRSSSKGKSSHGGRSGNRSGGKKSGPFSIILFGGLALVMAIGIYVGVIFATAPRVDTDDIYSMLAQRSIIYDSEGKEIENLYMDDGNRTIIDYDEIPEDMVNAIVALEDKKFWKHNGFNFIRMGGAIVDSVFGGGQISGTSTVTQQLARNVYLAEIKSQRSLSRKLSEMYCTIVLEKNLPKEKIMEAYLNTIYLGFNSYGIEAAAQSYFSKDANKMDVLECASLAALPQSPAVYALVQYGGADSSLPVLYSDETTTLVYNGDLTTDRRNLVLKNMEAEGFITAEELDKALNEDLKKHMKVSDAANASATSYFTDYAIGQLTDDLAEEYGISESEAATMIYSGGLKIYSTMDSDIQKIVEKEFKDSSNFAGVAYARTNSDGDLLNPETGSIMVYAYSHYFDDNDKFTLKKSEYTTNDDGGITIKSGKRLNLYEVEVNGAPDVSIEFKNMYTKDNGIFYFIESGALSIPQGYKSINDDGDCVVSGDFFTEYPEFFKKTDDGLVVSKGNYSLKQKTRQPQGAMVIMENETGEIKAMIGGRETKGKQLFNRATNPRQPGSSIKPIGAYGPALQMSYEYHEDGKKMRLDTSEGSDWGNYITAGSVINDAKMSYGGRVWPKNWYSGYKGDMYLRKAVEQSVNVCAVKVYQQIGPDYSAKMLKKNGITTVDTEGEVNDLNPAALALGGMTSGISPLELTAAYATFPNGGVYNEPIAYTKVLDAHDEVILENKAEGKQVYDEGVAFIMTDILRTTVSRGIASGASIGVQPVGGKTGTTSDNFDIWFAGFTPQYSAAIWMGNDVNIEMSSGSGTTAHAWSRIMRQVCADIPYESFGDMPDNVQIVGGEYYIKGTYSKVKLDKSKTKTTKVTEPSTTEPTTTTTSESTTAPTIITTIYKCSVCGEDCNRFVSNTPLNIDDKCPNPDCTGHIIE